MKRIRFLVWMVLGGWVASNGAMAAVERSIVAVDVPAGVLAADGAYDARGRLHVVLARDAGCAHAMRATGEREFGPEHAIPVPGQPAVGGERRPHILTSGDGHLFALWQTRAGLVLALSTDAGESWSSGPAAALTAKTGADVFNAAVGPDGVLYIVWAGEKDPHLPDDQVSQHLYLASSSDGGRSFTEPRPITTDAARACPCCVPAIVCGKPGEVWVAYRSSVANIKETRVLASSDAGKTFSSRQLSDHHWELQGCPMAGPSMAVSGERAIVSWTSQHDMYTASSADGGKTYSAPERLGRGRFNQVAAGPTGQILQVWDEGTQTGVWWRDDARPSPRVDLAPGGVLIATPDGRFELLGPRGGEERHGR